MKNSIFQDQKDFMEACGQSTDGSDISQYMMYLDLITEEYNELSSAVAAKDDVEQLDALIDILVVTVGAIVSRGWDAQAAWDEVMSTNFAKVDPETGKVRKREDGKILKPDGWKYPNLKRFVEEN